MVSVIQNGVITSTGFAQKVAIPGKVSAIFIYNRTNAGSAANPGVVKRAWWLDTMPQGYAYTVKNTDGAATDTTPAVITSGGFSVYTDSPLVMGAPVAFDNPAFSQAAQAEFTTLTAHGYQVGDIVRVYGLTGALQYAGLDLSVIAVGSSTTFTTYLNTTGITQATAGSVRLLSSDGLYFPKNRYIAAMSSSGSSTVVTTTVAHGYQVGQKIRFNVPQPTPATPAFGFAAINGLVGTITAINAAVGTNTFTVDIDSSTFGSFVYPASTAVPFTFATVTPDSEGQPNPDPIPDPNQNVLVGAIDNRGTRGIVFGAGVVGAASDVIDWIAYGSAN